MKILYSDNGIVSVGDIFSLHGVMIFIWLLPFTEEINYCTTNQL